MSIPAAHAPADQQIPEHSHWYKGTDPNSFDDIPLPSSGPVMTADDATGLYPLTFEDQRFYLRAPKINGLCEVHARIAQYENLSAEEKSKPESAKILLAAVLPMLRKHHPQTGRLVPVTLEEAGDVMDVTDVVTIISVAFPAVEPAKELEAAGIDPKKPASSKRKTTGR